MATVTREDSYAVGIFNNYESNDFIIPNISSQFMDFFQL